MKGKQQPTQYTDRKRLAWMSTLLLFLVMLIVVTFISEPPFLLQKPIADTSTERAAVVIRDQASAYLQWGTMLFAWPSLKKGYNRVYYFNQRSDEDQKEEIIQTLRKALQQYEYVDLFLLAHGSNRFIGWIKSNIEYRYTRRLRLVYNTGCGNENQGPIWRKIGVSAYVGHGGGISISPVFFFFFLRRWVRGFPLEKAIHEANWYTRSHLLLLGRLSLGILDGPGLWKDTQAIRFGNPKLKIDTPSRPLLVSNLCTHPTLRYSRQDALRSL